MATCIHCLLTFLLISILISLSSHMKITTNSVTITSKTSEPNPQEASCDDVNPLPFIPDNFTDGIFSKLGNFMSCQNNFMIQFTSTKWLGQQTFQIKSIEPGVYVIYNSAMKKYVGFTNNLFHCVSGTIQPYNKFKITPIDVNRFTLSINNVYIGANPAAKPTSSALLGDFQHLWWTSIKYPTKIPNLILPSAFCRTGDCTTAALRFKKTGWYVNGILHACPDERKVDILGYDQDHIIIGFHDDINQFYIYVTPEGNLSYNIMSPQRYSLFKKINQLDGTFILQAWNGKYLSHIVSPTKEIVILENVISDFTKFGY